MLGVVVTPDDVAVIRDAYGPGPRPWTTTNQRLMDVCDALEESWNHIAQLEDELARR